uniref:Uncharacterized protein n=1 Tax=Rhizophora mucronata TaxID=61149 RepID=A0A2P2NJH7_RHIMU
MFGFQVAESLSSCRFFFSFVIFK